MQLEGRYLRMVAEQRLDVPLRLVHPLNETFTQARQLNPARVPSLAPFNSSPRSRGTTALQLRPKVEPPPFNSKASARGPSHTTYGLHRPRHTN